MRSALILIHMDILENWIPSQCNQAGNQPELPSGTATKAAESPVIMLECDVVPPYVY